MTIRKKKGAGDSVVDSLVQLVVSNVLAGANKADTSTQWTDTLTDVTYTWTHDELVTAGLTSALIGDADFGIAVQATRGTGDTAYLDSVGVTAVAGGECIDTECMYLDSDPGDCLTICGGPYEEEALCVVLCAISGDPVVAPCGTGHPDVPATLSLDVSNASAVCVTAGWIATTTGPGALVISNPSCVEHFDIVCDGTNYGIESVGAFTCGATVSRAIVYFSESPWIMVIDVTWEDEFFFDCCWCHPGGSMRFTITGA